MRRCLFFLLMLIPVGIYSQESDSTFLSHMRFSLITCSKGDDAASAFGHSAIRLTDSLHNNDYVFNYGTYSFDEPHFVLKFMRGEMNYLLSVNYFENFLESYKEEGRQVEEREINLTEEQKASLYAYLTKNYRPENRVYRYEFLLDNCATRIRDIFYSGPDFEFSDTLTRFTFREALCELYIRDMKWLRFGTDLLLGQRVDIIITSQEEMFLPCKLEENLSRYVNLRSPDNCNGGLLLYEPIVLATSAPGPSGLAKVLLFISQPVSVFTILALLLIIFFLKSAHRTRFLRISSSVIYAVLGLGGVMLVFMWFGTEHIWTKCNWNLLWMNPFFLLPLFMRSGKVRRGIIYVLAALSICPVVLWWLIPQVFNPAVIPIASIVCLLAFFEFVIKPKKI